MNEGDASKFCFLKMLVKKQVVLIHIDDDTPHVDQYKYLYEYTQMQQHGGFYEY